MLQLVLQNAIDHAMACDKGFSREGVTHHRDFEMRLRAWRNVVAVAFIEYIEHARLECMLQFGFYCNLNG